MVLSRPAVPIVAFVTGTTLMTGSYLGLFSWLEGWDYAVFQLERDGPLVVPIIIAFGLQSALFSILRFRLYAPAAKTGTSGLMMGASGGTSATAMVACCLHHAADVLPILGISAAATFLARNQRALLQLSLAMNLVGILIMVITLHRARQRLRPVLEAS